METKIIDREFFRLLWNFNIAALDLYGIMPVTCCMACKQTIQWLPDNPNEKLGPEDPRELSGEGRCSCTIWKITQGKGDEDGK